MVDEQVVEYLRSLATQIEAGQVAVETITNEISGGDPYISDGLILPYCQTLTLTTRWCVADKPSQPSATQK